MENSSKKKDEIDKTIHKPRSSPNCLSRLFLCWICPVLFAGNRRDVEEEDLIRPNKRYDSVKLGDYFESYWFKEVKEANRKNRKPSLWKALFRAFWLTFLPGGILQLIMATTSTLQPLLFTQLLSYWSVDTTLSRLEAGYYALGMVGLKFINMMSTHHNNLFVMTFSLKIKVACSALLYRKILRVSQVAAGEVAAGKLVNLLSNDVARFDYGFMFLHQLWIIPIQSAVVLYLLYTAAGYAPFVGLFGVVIIMLPLQVVLTKLSVVIRRETAKRTDSRIKLMSEIINGIQVIKMYAWEKPFRIVVKAVRAFEMKSIRKAIFVRSVFLGLMTYTERSILFLTCLTFILTGTMVTATTIYPIQQYFSIIQISLTIMLPFAIASLSEMMVSLERIEGFLLLEEKQDKAIAYKYSDNKATLIFDDKDKQQETKEVLAKKYSRKDSSHEIVLSAPPKQPVGEYAVEISGLTASWTKDMSNLTLNNISLRVRKGKLCAVIGPVGSGKSSLLQVLLKELPIIKGKFSMNGTVSYACQESWLFPATVRENILFGMPYIPHKYKEVCKVCSLLPDFKQFPYGDLSLVGERGVSLSGGQRARINLARSVYRDADIYLLDDPLSAVDANVGRQLFEGCINGYLKGNTCILITHQIHFLKAADFIVVLNDGAIENMGTYSELTKSDKAFSVMLTNLQEQAEGEDIGNDKNTKRPSLHRGVSRTSVKSEENPEEQVEQIQEAEERQKGSLKWSVVYKYLSTIQSWCMVVLTLLALLVTQGAGTATDYWLSFWTNQVAAYENSLEEGEVLDTNLDTQVGILTTGQYLIVYGSLIVAIIVILHLRIVAFVETTMRASKNFHDLIFKNLIKAVMRFFDTNPSGRVLNRFSKDMGALDELLPRSLLETIQMYLSMASILTLNAIALPWTLIPTFLLVTVFILLLKWYLNAAQAVKRLEGTTKSPVFSMINSTISGLSTIRSSNAGNRLSTIFDQAQDLHSSAFYTFTGGSAAFGLYLDALCLVYFGTVLAIFIFIDFADTAIPVGSVGLAVSQSMVLTVMLQMAARYTADFLAQMTAVERVLEYTKLPSEQFMDDGPTKTSEQWPSAGHLTFDNVYLKYGPDDPPVLRDLSFEIPNGWKVGIVGRTGAGKSSLISALFRLSPIEGSIKIDGIDTHGIAKQKLRSKISIIPQEPVLFSATLRYNLDPFEEYADDMIWRALEQVELKEAIPALDFKVSEGGSNFSVGQRQLVCLARAILRSNKILVMDEATANVDPQTDALIQKTIRREFASCTVLTIAHRLNTIMDSDRVLVMDKGQVAEFDHPYNLLSNPNSMLNFMVKETGDNMSKQLFEMAKAKYFTDNAHEKE